MDINTGEKMRKEVEVFGVTYDRYVLFQHHQILTSELGLKKVVDMPSHGAKAAGSLYSKIVVLREIFGNLSRRLFGCFQEPSIPGKDIVGVIALCKGVTVVCRSISEPGRHPLISGWEVAAGVTQAVRVHTSDHGRILVIMDGVDVNIVEGCLIAAP